jgi:hypothetical protein
MHWEYLRPAEESSCDRYCPDTRCWWFGLEEYFILLYGSASSIGISPSPLYFLTCGVAEGEVAIE